MSILAKKGVEPPIWRKSGILFAAMTALFFLLFGLFLGQSFQPDNYLGNINIYVVDFDQDAIGKKLLEVTSSVISAGGNQPGWFVFSAVQYTTRGAGVNAVAAAVDSGDAWGAVIANPNATARLNAALKNGATDYAPEQAITFYYDEGRSPTTIKERVIVPMRQLAQKVATQFAADFLKNNVNNITNFNTIIQTNPVLITNPVFYTETNLHPNTAPVVESSLSLGQVFLVVFCFAITQALMQLTGPLVLSLEISTLFSLRMRIILVFVLGISLWYTILHSALGVRFSASNWFSFWFLHALQMLVHIFTLIDLAILVGRSSPAFPLLFLIVLILNTTAGLAVIELGNPFYRWGYAMPMFNAVSASRTLIFGSYNRLALNVGILFAWLIILLLVYWWVQIAGRELDEEDDDDAGSFYANPAPAPRGGGFGRKWVRDGDDVELPDGDRA